MLTYLRTDVVVQSPIQRGSLNRQSLPVIDDSVTHWNPLPPLPRPINVLITLLIRKISHVRQVIVYYFFSICNCDIFFLF